MMIRKKREAADSENQVSPQIDSLLLIDREVDLLTPLFTQLTYEGLIDELYGIQNSKSDYLQETSNFRPTNSQHTKESYNPCEADHYQKEFRHTNTNTLRE